MTTITLTTSEILLEPRDLWVGLYWDLKPSTFEHAAGRHFEQQVTNLHLYLTLIPCFPIHLVFTRTVKL